MKIRQSTHNDIDRLVEIDRATYGIFGADKKYFDDKFQSFPQGILVVEENGNITGFTVIELLNSNQMPKDFTDFKPVKPLEGKWIHIIAFTTATNYQDIKSDSELVKAVEEIGKKFGCTSSCVPLTINHPLAKNGVFDFWKLNGYKIAGELNWIASQTEKIACYFYRKNFN